eukprot:6823192-Pyramimonas_sp.AAC.1
MLWPLRRYVYSQLHCQSLPGQDQSSAGTTQNLTHQTKQALRLLLCVALAVCAGPMDGRGERGGTDGGAAAVGQHPRYHSPRTTSDRSGGQGGQGTNGRQG